MKATGIVRRVDDLGRIVVPREMRRTLGIQQGDPIEFFVKGDQVVLSKYTPIDEVAVSLTQEDLIFLSGCAGLWTARDKPDGLFDKLEAARARFDS